jgi:group I intron endonuclease
MQKKIKSGIYKIINLVNGKFYIGSACYFNARKASHFHHLRNNTHDNNYLQNSWNKYGEKNFVFEIIEYVENKENLIKREQYYIDSLNPQYNLSKTAGSCLGYKWTEEMKQKRKDFYKENPISKEAREKMSITRRGRKLSEEHKRNISKGLEGREVNIETRLKIANSNRGKLMSEESKQKIRENGKRNFKSIIQMDLNNNFISEFSSGKEAGEALGIKPSYIYRVCQGRRSKYKQFKFKWK